MDFVAAVKTSLTRWADFQGIAPRSEYWWFQLFLALANLGLLFVGFFVSLALPDAGPAITALALIALWVLALVPAAALSVRRLRDGGFPWGLIFIAAIPFGGLALLVMYLMPTKTNRRDDTSADFAPTETVEPTDEGALQGNSSSPMERLTALHARGTINDQQFELAKKKLEGRSN